LKADPDMTVTVSKTQDGVTVLTLQGEFNFSLHKVFRDAYESAAAPGSCYIVDLAHVSRIDSSALGMLLQMRDHAGGTREAVRLINARGGVAAALRTLNFERLMMVTEAASEGRVSARG
jgi:HptB-dependent secretion and biofilm anti anti-sigma factor